MLRTLLFELLVFCVGITGPADGETVRFTMIEDHRRLALVTVTRSGPREQKLDIQADGERQSLLLRFVDNGLYDLLLPRDKVRVDVARYFIGFYPRRSGLKGPAKATIKDTNGRPLHIEQVGANLFVSSPSEKLIFVIPTKFLK